ERAIGPHTAALMRIHTSNYRIRGFTRAVTLEELVSLGRRYKLPVIDDIGSGLAVDLSAWGLAGEPLLAASLRAGADLVVCSGDKLFGGPQAGLIFGKKEWIQRLERDPFFRAVRPDKMTLAALAATLHHYQHPDQAITEVPVLRLLTWPLEQLQQRCQKVAERLRQQALPAHIAVQAQTAYAGGGSLPEVALPTFVICLRPHLGTEEQWAHRLRTGHPPVVVRRAQGGLWLDLRTVLPHQEEALIQRLGEVAAELAASVASASPQSPELSSDQPSS
ncbi:MAG: L-seryl-tRNA(Sec) selenium transferase, partial [Gemmataceae bacterium]|nr:L-seryl-tRNA(Sec) selenium transferase [Gemmataceae bacterium]